MIFSSNSIENILSGKKTQHRMLVKEGDISQCFPNNDFSIIKILEIFRNKKSIWCVGKSYAVQAGRGKKGKGLWYCPNCKHIIKEIQVPVGKRFECACENTYSLTITRQMVDAISYYKKIFNLEMKRNNWKPLRIKITGIKKERLNEITEEDAKREGYRSKADYFQSFCLINNINPKLLVNNNSEVWVLSFCLESD